MLPDLIGTSFVKQIDCAGYPVDLTKDVRSTLVQASENGEIPGLVDRIVVSNSGLPYRDVNEPLPDVIDASGPFAALIPSTIIASVNSIIDS